MQTYLKTRPAWIQLFLFLGMAFGLFIAISYIGATVLSSITGISLLEFGQPQTWDRATPGLITFIRGMQLVQFLGLFFIPSLLFAYFSDPQPAQYLQLRRPWKAYYWVLGIGLMLLALPMVEYTGQLNRQVNFGGDTQQMMQSLEESAMRQVQFMLSRRTSLELALNILFIAVLAGVGEELFFRGVLQRIFIRATRSPWAGIVLAALLFSTFHFQFFGFVPRFLMGVLLGAIAWFSGSLWVAILAHTVYNGLLVFLAYRQPEMLERPDATVFDPATLAIAGLVSLLLVGGVMWLVIRRSRTYYADVFRDDHPPHEDLSI